MTGKKRRQPKKRHTAAGAGSNGSVCYIDRLQNELLWEIFLFYSSTTTIAGFGDYGPSRVNTNHIACVNKRWNPIALAIPLLWSKIYVAVEWFSHGRSLEAFLDRRLELSKDAPLDICVLFSEEPDDYDEHIGDGKRPLPVLAKLFQHAHRWQSAVLQLPESYELKDTEFPDTFPILQELEMRCLPYDDAGTDRCPEFCAPLLRKFTMEKFAFGGNFGSSHLNEITLIWVVPDTVMDFLRDASSECNVEVFIMYTPYTDYNTTATTSRLKSLSVVQTDADEYEDAHRDLLQNLTLLNVEKLVFIDDRTGRAGHLEPEERAEVLFPVADLLSMFARSEPSLMKLSHLEFSGHYISDQNLLKILTVLPALAFFAFKETSLFDEKLNALTAHFFQAIVSAEVIPKLTRIDLIFCSKTVPVPVDDLMLFLESRRPSLEGDRSCMRLLPLEQAQIGIYSAQTRTALMDRLAGLCSGGLIVKVLKTRF